MNTQLAVTEPAELELASSDRTRLAQLEGIVERGIARFIEVGEALLEIRDRRLYRLSHRSFAEYCRERFGFARAHAYRLITAAEVVRVVSPMGDSPLSERQARELAPLLRQPQALSNSWEEARKRADREERPLRGSDLRAAVTKRRDPGSRLAVHYSSASDAWETPAALYDRLNGEFAFTLDVCATAENAKCERYYTPAQDGLEQEWRGSCWMNPPYGSGIGRWVGKASASAAQGATVVALLPARTDTGWWWDHCRQAEIRFLRGRLRFNDGPTGAPFPSAIVVFGRPATVLWWDWRTQ